MFTVADIRNIAIQIEENGEQTYRKAAMATDDLELRDIFTKMAEDEAEHAKWLASIAVDRELTEEQRAMEAVGKSLLQEMVRGNTFSLDQQSLNDAENLEELLKTSQGFEKDTILFYEMLSGFIDDDQAMQQLQSIIQEEHNHFAELQNLANKKLLNA